MTRFKDSYTKEADAALWPTPVPMLRPPEQTDKCSLL